MKHLKAGTVYAIVDYSGNVRITPPSITRQEMHSANLVIRVREDGETMSVFKDRWEAARKLFNIVGNELTRQQADEIVVYHISLALKGMRS